MSRKHICSFWVIAPIATFLSACGGTASPASPKHRDIETTHKLPSGSLEELYLGVSSEQASENGFFPYECDATHEKTKLEVAQFVDQNTKTVALALSAGAQDSFENLPQADDAQSQMGQSRRLGPITINAREAIDPNAPEWTVSSDPTWEQIQDLVVEARKLIKQHNYVGAVPYLQFLDYQLRARAPDEQRRRVHGTNYSLQHENMRDFAELQKQMLACLSDVSCLPANFEPRLSATAATIMKDTYVYSKLYEWMMLEASAEEGRDRMRIFEKWIENDLRFYRPHNTQAVRRLSAGNFEVLLSAGPLGHVEAEVADFVAELWSGSGRTLKLTFVDANQSFGDLNPFRFEILASQGRGYVSYGERKVALPQSIQYGTLHHEMGHVLGLKDAYYTTYNTKTCVYEQRSRPRDLMSDSSRGSVLEDHWNLLETLYSNPSQ